MLYCTLPRFYQVFFFFSSTKFCFICFDLIKKIVSVYVHKVISAKDSYSYAGATTKLINIECYINNLCGFIARLQYIFTALKEATQLRERDTMPQSI